MISRVVNIGKTYRQARRSKEIVGVLIRHGFGDLLRAIGLTRWLGLRRARRRGESFSMGPTRYMRVRLAMEELGPTFVKLGQLLSTRCDVIPTELLSELERLQSSVPPFTGDEALLIVESELGDDAHHLFSRFDTLPLASASISQVHEAATREGARVVVKVQRPGIREIVETDLEILHSLASLLERYVPEAKVFEPIEMVREFSRLILAELDFSTEASNIERIEGLFGEHPGLRIPHVHRQLCSSRVLTMDYIDGVKLSTAQALQNQGLDPEKLVATCSDILFRQIFFHGFFHSDPHPGNLLALPGNRICFLDYGQMGTLSESQREDFAQLLYGLVKRDERRIAEAVFSLADYDALENYRRVQNEIRKFCDARLYRPIKDIHVGPLLNDLSRMLVDFEIHLPADFFVVCKSLTTYDGVVRAIHPDFNAIQFAAPLANQLISRRLGGKRLLRDFMANVDEMQHLLKRTPRELRETLSLLRRGEINLGLHHHGLARTQNRHALGMVSGALAVAGAILLHSGGGPQWLGLPVSGLTVAGGALIAMFCFLVSSLRNGGF